MRRPTLCCVTLFSVVLSSINRGIKISALPTLQGLVKKHESLDIEVIRKCLENYIYLREA
jgi:hypothetical protein